MTHGPTSVDFEYWTPTQMSIREADLKRIDELIAERDRWRARAVAAEARLAQIEKSIRVEEDSEL